jgi:hypothetical protein
VTGSPDYVVIARVVVPPTAATNGILQANIQQLLTNFTVPVGGLLPVADQSARDALTGTRYDGMTVWRMDRDWVEAFDGTAWRVQSTAVCSSTADRNSAITNPYSGQLAMTTDTDTLWQYDGTTSAWVAVGGNPFPKGRLYTGRPGADSAGITTTEVVVDSRTIRPGTGRKIGVRWSGSYVMTTALSTAEWRFRWRAGTLAQVTGSTESAAFTKRALATGEYLPFSWEDTIEGYSVDGNGDVTVMATAIVVLGGGTLTVKGGGSTNRRFIVDDAGA